MSLVLPPQSSELDLWPQISGKDISHGPTGNRQKGKFWETNLGLALLTYYKVIIVTFPEEVTLSQVRVL